jgi:hypothetical protein
MMETHMQAQLHSRTHAHKAPTLDARQRWNSLAVVREERHQTSPVEEQWAHGCGEWSATDRRPCNAVDTHRDECECWKRDAVHSIDHSASRRCGGVGVHKQVWATRLPKNTIDASGSAGRLQRWPHIRDYGWAAWRYVARTAAYRPRPLTETDMQTDRQNEHAHRRLTS